MTFGDPDHSADEMRFISIGLSSRQRLLLVALAEKGEPTIRVISARVAAQSESMPTKKRDDNGTGELRREYDLTALKGGVRGKYYERVMARTNLMLIEPEIAEVFPDSEVVNEALRGLIDSDKSRRRKQVALKAARNRATRRNRKNSRAGRG